MDRGNKRGNTHARSRISIVLILIVALCFAAGPTSAQTPAFFQQDTRLAAAAQSGEPLPTTPVGKPPERQRRPQPIDEISTIFEQKGVLTPKRTIILEPSVQYAYSSSNRVALLGFTILPAITIGVIEVRSVDSSMAIGSLALRYGITNRLELEYKIPYVYRSDTSATVAQNAPVADAVFSADGKGFGDVEGTVRYQLNQPAGRGTFFIGSLRAKARNGKDPFEVPIDNATGLPTELPRGSGFWAFQPAITAIFPTDPVALFGSISYQWNVKRDIGGIGTIDPGDAFGMNVGMGIGLNEKTSISLGYDHSVIGRNTRNGQRLSNSTTTQVGSLLLGTSYRLSERTNLNFSLGVGVTEAAPDIQVLFKLPTSAL